VKVKREVGWSDYDKTRLSYPCLKLTIHVKKGGIDKGGMFPNSF